MTSSNPWCTTLGIAVPRLESVAGHREANTYSLMMVALLECGAPMTLEEIAHRFARAGIDDAPGALRSLKRCKPGRPPVYREGDRYALDPHDDELDLWAFRLGLRPAKVAGALPKPPPPQPANDVPLTLAELETFLEGGSWSGWSETRVALAVLDAKNGALSPDDVKNTVHAHVSWGFRRTPPAIGRKGSPISVLADGRWAIAEGAGPALTSMRAFVRERVALAHEHAAYRPDAAAQREREEARATRASDLAKLSHALVVAYPVSGPVMTVVVDVSERTLTSYGREDRARLRDRLGRYDVIGAIDVRPLVRALGFDAGERRLAELGPPQKSMRINRSGRTLRITAAMLVQGSCGISQPFGDESKLAAYVAAGDIAKLQRRLEADAKSLYALYQFGRLHGGVRLRWGFIDEWLSAPWAPRDEPKLYDLLQAAAERGGLLDVVVGSAPGWSDPWSRVRSVRVVREGWHHQLVGEDGSIIDADDVQLARAAQTPVEIAASTPTTPAAWLEEIALAYADAREVIAIGPLTGSAFRESDLFHLAPAVCVKLRGLDPSLHDAATAGALASYDANAQREPWMRKTPVLGFAFCYLAAHFALGLVDERVVNVTMNFVLRNERRLHAMLGG
jgi:hypothetical protein